MDSSCKNKIKQMPSDISKIINGNYADAADIVCSKWKRGGQLGCVSKLGDSVDKVDAIKEHLSCSTCGSKSMLRYFVENTVDGACDFMDDMRNSPVTGSNILDKIPDVAEWYKNAYNALPSFAKGFLPNFPTSSCPGSTITSIANKVKAAMRTPSRIPNLLCAGTSNDLTQTDMNCIRAIESSITSVSWISGAIGSTETFSKLLGTHRDNACKFVNEMGVLEGKTFDVTATLEALPSMSTWISDLSDDLQSIPSLNKYFPVWPKSQCTSNVVGEIASIVSNGMSDPASANTSMLNNRESKDVRPQHWIES